MDKLMTLGIALTAIDQVSRPIAKVQERIGTLAKHAGSVDMRGLSKGLEDAEQKASRLGKAKLTLISSLKKADKTTQGLRSRLRQTQEQISALNKKKFTIEDGLKKGTISAKEAKKQLKSVADEAGKLNAKKIALSQALDASAQKADRAASAISRIDTQIKRVNANKMRINKEIERTKTLAVEADERLKRMSLTLGKYAAFAAAAGKMATGSMMKTVFAYKEVQKAQGDAASLGIDDSGIKKITAAAEEMSRQYAGVTMPAFIRASYDIKSGIASLSDEGVAKFTKMASITASATKASTEEMTKLFALGYGIFKRADETDISFGRRFSASVAQAVQDFRTDGADLTQGISNIGAVAKSMGVSLAQELAVIGNAKKAFNSAAEAGTAYRAFLAGAVKAQEKLGISLTDTHGKLLPMRMVIDQIRKKFGDLDALEMNQLKEAFGSEEAVKIITALMNETDKLAASEARLSKANFANVESMAKVRNRGHEFTLMMQKLSVLSSKIGEKLSPMFDMVAEKISGIISWVDRLISSPAGAWIVYTAAALASLLLVLGTVGLAVAAFTGYMAYASKALTLFSAMSRAGAMGMMLLQAAMSPVVLIAAAIAAIVYLIIDNWSVLSGWFSAIWSSIVSIFSSAMGWITSLVTDPVATISQAWSGLVGWFGSLWSGIVSIFSSVAGRIAPIVTDPVATISQAWSGLVGWLGSLWSGIVSIFSSVAGRIASLVTDPVATISQAWSGLVGWLGSLWSGIVSIFSSVAGRIASIVTDPVATISQAWSGLVGWFGSFWGGIGEVFAAGATYVAKIFTDPIWWIRRLWGKLLSWLGEKINKIKGIVNSIANFVGYGDVFKISVDGSGAGGNGGESYRAKSIENTTSIVKPLQQIAKQTAPIAKLNDPKIAPFSPKKSLKKQRTAAGGAGSSRGSGGIRSRGYQDGGAKNYTINIRIFGNSPDDIGNKLKSILPGLISDIESNTLSRRMYDL